MKKTIYALFASLPMVVVGCGTGTDGIQSTEGSAMGEGEVMAVALTGSGRSGESEDGSFAEETQADVNAKIMEAVSVKIEEELNMMLEDEEFLAELEEAELEAGAAKDVSVKLGLKGLTVSIRDEAIPFAGGALMLNGDIGLKLALRSRGTIAIEATGDLTADMDKVTREGEIKGIPYSLSLEGRNYMDMEGSIAVEIKSFKIKNMSADFRAGIVNSDVTATGTIADKSVTGSVDMVDVAIRLANADVLKNPGNFSVTCSGAIETSLNDNVVASCEIDDDCLGCK